MGGLLVAMYALTDTPAPSLNTEALGLPEASLPAINFPVSLPASQPAGDGSLAAYTSGVRRWEGKILQWEKQYGVDRHIIATIMQVESCGDDRARGPSGEYGLFQLMPIHFAPGETRQLDPDVNAATAMGFFTRMHQYTGYDVYQTFIGYNGGYAAVGKSFQYLPVHTQTYHTLTKGIYDDVKAGLNPSPTIQSAVSGKRCPA
jgi:soluble lytic murein transglycosylase-like protein